MSLTDTAIRNAKPADKPYKLSDRDGLYLHVKPAGKYWRMNYRFNGKQQTLALGVYPEVSLKEARERLATNKQLLSSGVNPSEAKKNAKKKKPQTFENLARDCLTESGKAVREVTHAKKIRRFERHVFPAIGAMPINDVKPADIYNALKPLIDREELETAHRVHSEIVAVFNYAINHGLVEFNIAQPVGKRIPAHKAKHRAALTEPKDVSKLLRDIYNYQGTFVVQMAFRLSPMLFQRPGEIRQMEWQHIDLEACEWRYLVTKTDVQHIVPLSTQAIEILNAIKPFTGLGRYVFPSSRSDERPMSDNTIRTALLGLGYDSDTMTAHGFRSMASTLLNEQGWSPDAIERQLCHMPKDQVRAAYNRAQYLDERRRMMQSWADYLEGLRVTR